MKQLDFVAERLGTSERTLRRAASGGLIRAIRRGPRRIALPPAEESYLRQHWTILASLRRALRTERNVRLAVLFGSVARGEDHSRSDVDLLMAFGNRTPLDAARLRRRLREALGRDVQIVSMASAHQNAGLLADVLRDGRLLIDRDGRWNRLQARREAFERAARAADAELFAAEASALESFRCEAGS